MVLLRAHFCTVYKQISIMEKNTTKWTIWLILSILWVFTNFLVTIIIKPADMYILGSNWLFVSQYCLSLINVSACVYIGAK